MKAFLIPGMLLLLLACNTDQKNSPEVAVEKSEPVEPVSSSLIWDHPQVPVFLEKEGLVKMEAESLQEHVTDFSLQQEPGGFSGTGYLRWDGHGHNTGSLYDANAEYRNGSFVPENERMVFKFEIKEAGNYRMQIHLYHPKEDGDNDVWISYPETDALWHKIGDHLKPGVFTWNSWANGVVEGKEAPEKFYAPLEAGIHYLYLAGRSHGFGIDFVTIHDERYEGKNGDLVAAAESDRR
jgi:hypothetical protein